MANDSDIIVVVVNEKNKRTGRMEQIVSHGYDTATGRNVILSSDSPASIGAVFDTKIGEYVIKGKNS